MNGRTTSFHSGFFPTHFGAPYESIFHFITVIQSKEEASGMMPPQGTVSRIHSRV